MLLILFKYGTPSTTYKGSLLPLIVPKPLILIVAALPGCPDPFTTVTPATSPANACDMLETDFACKFSALTTVAVPVKACFVLVPYPTTTTSSKTLLSSTTILALTVLDAPIFFSTGVKPKYLKTKTSPLFARIEYFPSKSVSVPLLVPFTDILTPGKGPEFSVTVPETVLSCANEICTINAKSSVKNPLNFVFIV